jgi:hypothetical protein
MAVTRRIPVPPWPTYPCPTRWRSALPASTGSSAGFIDSIGTADSDVEKNINGSTVSGGRVSMLFKPSEAFSLQLTAFIQDIDSDASSSVDSDSVTGKTLYGDLTQSQYVPESTDVSYHVYNATAIWDLGFGDLTSATSYGENEQKFLVDFTTLLSGFFPGFDSFNRQTTSVQRFTQELRLASHENDKVDWLVGAYYNDEDGLIAQDVHVVERTRSPISICRSCWAPARSTRTTRNTRRSRT